MFQPVLSWLSCHGSLVLPVPFWLSYTVLAALFWLSYSCCPFLSVLSACPAPPVLFCLPSLPILLCLSCFACPILPFCSVLPFLFCLPGLHEHEIASAKIKDRKCTSVKNRGARNNANNRGTRKKSAKNQGARTQKSEI
jgi:hypothetical protein